MIVHKGIECPILFFKEDYSYVPDNKFNYPTEKEKELLVEFCQGADLIGFNVFSGFYNMTKELVLLIKEKIGVPVVFGGIHPTLAADECLDIADFIVVGDGEPVVDELIRIAKTKKIEQNKTTPQLFENLDKLPFPDWTEKLNYKIEFDKLTHEDRTPYLVEYLCMTARGCPFHCTYCCNSKLNSLYPNKKNLRRRSVDDVMDELVQAKKTFPNIGKFDFTDDVFTMDSKWIKEFAPKYKKHINIPFSCLVHPIMTRKRDMVLLKKAGLKSVVIGIQSGSKNMLYNVFRRQTPPKKIIDAVNMLKELKLEVFCDLIIDTPYDTEETMKETFKLLMELIKPFRLQILSLAHLPYTELTERLLKEKKITKEEVEGQSSKSMDEWYMFQKKKSNDLTRYWYNIFMMCGYPMISNNWLEDIVYNKKFKDNIDTLEWLRKKMTGFYDFKLFKLHKINSIHLKHLKVKLLESMSNPAR